MHWESSDVAPPSRSNNGSLVSGDLSFLWIQIYIGSPMRRSSYHWRPGQNLSVWKGRM